MFATPMGPVEVLGRRVAILHWRILVDVFLIKNFRETLFHNNRNILGTGKLVSYPS